MSSRTLTVTSSFELATTITGGRSRDIVLDAGEPHALRKRAYAMPFVLRSRPVGVIRETGAYQPRFDAEPRGPIVPRMVAADTERLTASLPAGYRARPFADRDREAWVAERNTWYGPMEQG